MNTCQAPGLDRDGDSWRQSQQVPQREPQPCPRGLLRKPCISASAPNFVNYWFANAGGSRRETVITGSTNRRKEINFKHEFMFEFPTRNRIVGVCRTSLNYFFLRESETKGRQRTYSRSQSNCIGGYKHTTLTSHSLGTFIRSINIH